MKTSFKILIPTLLFMFIMVFAIFVNVKAEVNKYVTGEIKIKKNKLANFSNIVVNTKSTVNLYLANENTIYGEIDLNNYKVLNDTLYITDTNYVKLDFINIKSITSNSGSNIIIDSINTKKMNIYSSNNSTIDIKKGVINSITISSDSSSIYLSKCNLKKIEGELRNNSFMRFNSRINSINVEIDTSSYFNSYGWRRNK